MPATKRFDQVDRPIAKHCFAEVIRSDKVYPAALKPMTVFTPRGTLTIVHRKVSPGDFVYYRLDYGQPIHVYARVDELRSGQSAFCEAFSKIVPDGEYGDVELDQFFTKISAEEFAAARAAGWPDPSKILEQAA